MSGASEEHAFQVNLSGVIALLSQHIYSGPQVFLRELLQNGRDAIEARRLSAGLEVADPTWGIRIVPVSKRQREFRFIDTGVGLTRSDVTEFLATVGQSSKRDEFDVRREGFLGQFGIGLLSCFMVAEVITIRSRSARGDAPVEWQGKSDGTFTVREITGWEARKVAVGTEVILVPRPDDVSLVSLPNVLESARDYSEFMRVPVRVDLGRSTESINREPVFTSPVGEPGPELFEFGTELLGVRPLDIIELSVPETGTRGVAFVLPSSPQPGTRSADRVYLGGVLVSAASRQLVPDWAFFVRAVIMTDGLTPTASREQFVEDTALDITRERLGLSIRRWIVELAATDPIRLADFLGTHELALKGLVAHDDDLAGALVPSLVMDTSDGPMSVREIVDRTTTIRFTDTVDEFRQVVAVQRSGNLVVNGGYVHDAAILRRIPSLFAGVAVEKIRVSDELDSLDLPPAGDQERARVLEKRATSALATIGIDVIVRAFEPHDLPSLYVADSELLRSIHRGSAREVATGIWGSIVDQIEDEVTRQRAATGAGTAARLCLNWHNPLVQTLQGLDDELVLERTVRLLYIQALLAGQRTLTAADRTLLTTSLTDLVHLSVAQGALQGGLDDPTEKD